MTINELLEPMCYKAQVRITNEDGDTFYFGSAGTLRERLVFILDAEVLATTVHNNAFEICID